MESNVNLAGEFLRRMAPTQTHEGRRQFQRAALLMEGVDLPTDGVVVYTFPIKRQGVLIGQVETTVDGFLDPPGVETRWRERTEDDGFVGEGT